MKAKEIRQKYIEFFTSHGHKEIKSASLIPDNDPISLPEPVPAKLIPMPGKLPHKEGKIPFRPHFHFPENSSVRKKPRGESCLLVHDAMRQVSAGID